jgi:hypothetical protein
MAENFDPYHRWLSIPPEEQPPNHYRLLGLKVLESDLDVIESAADRQMTHVRTFQGGKYADDSQRILNEISTAKVTLLDPSKKKSYDAALTAKLEEAKRARRAERPLAVAQPLPAVETPLPLGQPPVAQPPTVAPPMSLPAANQVSRANPQVSALQRRKRSGLPPVALAAIGGIALAVVAALGALALVARPWESSTEVALDSPAENPAVVPQPTPPDNATKPPRVVQPPGITPPPVDPPITTTEEPPVEPPPEASPDDEELPDDTAEVPEIDIAEEEEIETLAPPPRAPVPTKAEREAKLASVEAVLPTAKAKAPAEKAALARQLLRTASETPDDLVAQFVMLNLARELAADSAQMQLAFDAIDLLDEQFEIDGDTVRISTVAQGARALVPNEMKQEVVALGVELADHLAAADRYEDASRVLTGLIELARRARELQLSAALVERRRVSEARLAAYKSAQASFDTLKKSPDDRAANLAVGRFYLFAKHDAARGLTHLAKGSDEPLAAAAKLELTNPQSPAEQEKLASAWWDLAAQATDKDEQKNLKSRSFAWYQRVQPELKGLDAAKADKRLQELADAGVQPAEINLDLGVFDDAPSAARRLPPNLLDLIDVNLHAVRHVWERRGKEVAASDEGAALLRIPVDIRGSYRFRTEFTRETGSESVGVSLPVGGHRCIFLLSAYTGGAGGLMLIDGRELRDKSNPARVAPSALTNGERYVVEIAVTVKDDQAAIVAAVNGKPYCRWQGAASSLSVFADHSLTEPQQIGLYARLSRTVFHHASLTLRDGTATPAADAVLPKVVAQPRRLPANLLDLVEPDAHAVNQKWTRDGDDIIAPKSFAALLKIPATIDGGYDATLEFTRTDGGDIVGFVLPVGETQCEVMLSNSGGELGGLAQIDGKPLAEGPAKVTPCRLTNGQRYALRARVALRGDQVAIDITLDDKPFLRWAGAVRSLSVGGHRDVRAPQHFGLYANDAQVSFHSLKLLMLTGSAAPDADAVLPIVKPRTTTSGAVDVTRGLVAHWKFDDGKGTVARDAVSGHDATVKGAVWVKGIRGNALRFDGQDDLVEIGNPAELNFAGPISISAWTRLNKLPGARGKESDLMNVVVHCWKEPQRHEVYLRLFNRGSAVQLEAGGYAGDEKHASLKVGDDDVGRWVHWCSAYDGQAWTIYRNGDAVARQPSQVGALKIDSSWCIGSQVSGDRIFDGDIDDVRIYNRGLSADEVKSLAKVAAAAPSNDDDATSPPQTQRETLPAAPLPARVVITRAVYGAGGQVVDVTEKVRAALAADPFAPLQADDRSFGDPASGTQKELVITYAVAGKPQTVRLNQQTPVHLPELPAAGLATKDASQEFRILAARYGAGLTWIDITEAVRGTVTRTDVAYQWSFHDSDPWFGVAKRSSVWFDYQGKRYHRFFTDGEKQALLH